ncbi:MAG: hypothetical protein GX422_05785 [Deltaproteobacteria bacterium]|nr:hypothetical protein [Deltaproteobacteria bacterium]
MENQSKKKWIKASLLIIALAVGVKVIFTFGPLFFKESVKLSPPEVLAGDQKEKTADPVLAKAGRAQGTQPASPASTMRNEPGQQTGEAYAFIQQKEAELKQREEDLRAKEEYLSKIEKEVEQKLKELIAVQKEIQAYRSEREENQNGKVRSLAKIYGTMKPKEAAKLLDNLDEKLVMNIISTMSPDEAAGILSNMDVKKAAKISEALSNR